MGDAPPEYISSGEEEIFGDDAVAKESSSSSSSSTSSSSSSSADEPEPAVLRAQGKAPPSYQDTTKGEKLDDPEVGVSSDDDDKMKVSEARKSKEGMTCLLMGSVYLVAGVAHLILASTESSCDMMITILMGFGPAIAAILAGCLVTYVWRMWSTLPDDTDEYFWLHYLKLLGILRKGRSLKILHFMLSIPGFIFSAIIIPGNNTYEECVSFSRLSSFSSPPPAPDATCSLLACWARLPKMSPLRFAQDNSDWLKNVSLSIYIGMFGGAALSEVLGKQPTCAISEFASDPLCCLRLGVAKNGVARAW
jgi:hypothetical protein